MLIRYDSKLPESAREMQKEQRILEIMGEIREVLAEKE